MTLYALYFLTFLIPTYFLRINIGFMKTNVFEVALFITFLTYMVEIYKSHRMGKKIKFEWGPIWPYIFLAAAAIAIFLAPDKVKAIGIFKGWFMAPAIYYWLIINVINPSTYKRLLVPLFMSLQIVSIWALCQTLFHTPLLPFQAHDETLIHFLAASPRRVFSFFESPNYLAMFIIPTFFLTLPLASYIKEQRRRILVGCSFFIPALALFFSQSRGGFIAFMAILIIISAMSIFAKKDILSRVGDIAGVIMRVGMAYYLVNFFHHPNSNEARLKIYHYSRLLLKQFYMKGVGLGGYQTALAHVAHADQAFLVYNLPFAYHPHSLFLAIWLNMGLFGIVAFAGVIIDFAIKGIRRFDQATGRTLVFAMITILVHGFFDTTYFKNDLAAIFWLILAAMQIQVQNSK